MESIKELRKCPYCGKEYKNFKMGIVNTLVPVCDCEEKAYQAEQERKIKIAKEEAKRKKLERLFVNSMMSPFFKEKTFESLDINSNLIICKKYANDFIPQISDGIQMIGNVGTGKTTLLAAICNELMEKGYNCLFTTLSSLLDKFSSFSYEHSGNITPLLDWIAKFDFVVLDDIGREAYTAKRKEAVFRIIDTLLNHKVVTAFTANPEMIEKLKQIPEFTAALDRLKGMCKMQLEFRGNSLR